MPLALRLGHVSECPGLRVAQIHMSDVVETGIPDGGQGERPARRRQLARGTRVHRVPARFRIVPAGGLRTFQAGGNDVRPLRRFREDSARRRQDLGRIRDLLVVEPQERTGDQMEPIADEKSAHGARGQRRGPSDDARGQAEAVEDVPRSDGRAMRRTSSDRSRPVQAHEEMRERVVRQQIDRRVGRLHAIHRARAHAIRGRVLAGRDGRPHRLRLRRTNRRQVDRRARASAADRSSGDVPQPPGARGIRATRRRAE